MLTVPQTARQTGRNPETFRRWIRSGRLRSTMVGTQHLIDEADLEAVTAGKDSTPLPDWLARKPDGRPRPNWVAIIRDQRSAH